MPFAGYKDFDDCVKKNADKSNPQAYCGAIKHKVEDTKKETLKQIGNVKKTISTAKGPAEYIGTEVEDSNGRWNDNYNVRDGFWVLHEGEKHHVYKSKESFDINAKPKNQAEAEKWVKELAVEIHKRYPKLSKDDVSDVIDIIPDYNLHPSNLWQIIDKVIKEEGLEESLRERMVRTNDAVETMAGPGKVLSVAGNTALVQLSKASDFPGQIFEYPVDKIQLIESLREKLSPKDEDKVNDEIWKHYKGHGWGRTVQQVNNGGMVQLVQNDGASRAISEIEDGEDFVIEYAPAFRGQYAKWATKAITLIREQGDKIDYDNDEAEDLDDEFYTFADKMTDSAFENWYKKNHKGKESVSKESLRDWKQTHENMWENRNDSNITIRYYRLTGDNWGVSLYKNLQPIKKIAKSTSEEDAKKATLDYMRSYSESFKEMRKLAPDEEPVLPVGWQDLESGENDDWNWFDLEGGRQLSVSLIDMNGPKLILSGGASNEASLAHDQTHRPIGRYRFRKEYKGTARDIAAQIIKDTGKKKMPAYVYK
jgi:hypothetical protein